MHSRAATAAKATWAFTTACMGRVHIN